MQPPWMQFISKLLCLCLVIGALFVYQSKAKVWAENQERNEAEIRAAEEYNQKILAAKGATSMRHTDGDYIGTGTGFGGDITVTVTVAEGAITDIAINSAAKEDAAYFAMAEEILKSMMDAQTWEVDVVSGATFSSNGIKEAVENALEQAVSQ